MEDAPKRREDRTSLLNRMLWKMENDEVITMRLRPGDRESQGTKKENDCVGEQLEVRRIPAPDRNLEIAVKADAGRPDEWECTPRSQGYRSSPSISPIRILKARPWSRSQ